MYVVHFYENKNHLLTQLLKQVPSEGQDLKVKGRKGKVLNISQLDEKTINVQVTLEIVKKGKVAVDNSKKKKR